MLRDRRVRSKAALSLGALKRNVATVEANPERIRIDFFCDSSSHRNARFMVVGGIALRRNRYETIEKTVLDIKEKSGISSEMKWSEYRGGAREKAYKDVVDLFYLLLEKRQIAFHALIAEFGEFSHRRGGGNADKSVNKMYFQLALHRICRYYGKRCHIHIYPDNGADSADLPKFMNGINIHAARKFGCERGCIRSIQQQDSRNHNVMQMVDVIIGAIAAHRNGRHLDPSTKACKRDLCEYILSGSGLQDWSGNSPEEERFFSIWNFRHTK